MHKIERLVHALLLANFGFWLSLLLVVVGLGLLAIGATGVWPACLGGGLMLLSLTGRYVLARKLDTHFQASANERPTTIYMPLLGEGTDVWRPVEAMPIGEIGYMVTQKMPDDEKWAFQPGLILKCETRQLDGADQLVPVAKAT